MLVHNLFSSHNFFISPDNATVGERLTLKIISTKFINNIKSIQEFGDFELDEYNLRTDTLYLFYKIWNPNSKIINPIITLKDLKEIKFGPISYSVYKITDENSTFKSIKGFKKIKTPYYLYAIIIISIIILMYIYYYIRRKIFKISNCSEINNLKRELNKLSEDLEINNMLQVYLELNSILKRYIKAKYFINSESMASVELINYLNKRNNLEIPKLLNKFEKIIYAKKSVLMDDMNHDINQVAHQLHEKQ